MRSAAFPLAGIPLADPADYAAALASLFKRLQIGLAVLPAYTSLLLYRAQNSGVEAHNFYRCFEGFMLDTAGWNEQYLRLHGRLAEENRLYLAAGTTIEEESGRFFHTAYLFGPHGKICGRQRQTHLSREERALGLSRGEELCLFELEGLKTGLIVGTDAHHPEVGRILALEGADLVIHCGALAAGPESAAQPAGIWAQVQQNQFWAVEAQLGANCCGRTFSSRCAVIGPCEVTPDLSGYLDRETAEKPYAAAELVEVDRLRIKKDYPLLGLLHPEAYRGLLPELYRS